MTNADALAEYRSALTERLTTEWDDAALANSIVDAVDVPTLHEWIRRIPIDGLADATELTYDVAATTGPFDALLVYAFGHRGPDGEREPGPVNEALAASVVAHVTAQPVPVYAQLECGDALLGLGIDDVHTVPLQRRADGSVIYQSTTDFTDEVSLRLEDSVRGSGRIGVVAFSDHLGRCVQVARARGLDAVRIAGIDLPRVYDPSSTQPWTRDRRTYLEVDLHLRMA